MNIRIHGSNSTKPIVPIIGITRLPSKASANLQLQQISQRAQIEFNFLTEPADIIKWLLEHPDYWVLFAAMQNLQLKIDCRTALKADLDSDTSIGGASTNSDGENPEGRRKKRQALLEFIQQHCSVTA